MNMRVTNRDVEIQVLEGVIQHVDLINRDLTVLVRNGIALFDVPLNCKILLHGEAVKLRLLQPFDHVRLTSSLRNGIRTVECIEAGPIPHPG